MKINIYFTVLLFILLGGCTPKKQPLALIPVPKAALPSTPVEDEPLFPVSSEAFSFDNSPEIQAALKEFSTSGKAPIVKRAGFVQFPYGEVQPILNCQPSYGCDIELEAGEKVNAVILGNEPLWDYLVWESNQQFEPIAHVTIGPRTPKVKTNAIIGTDRRTYHLELVSSESADYIRSAKFYYPRERLKEYQARQKQIAKREKTNKDIRERNSLIREISSSSTLPYQLISFGWEIDASRSVTWKPIRVFDDGAHIYLQFPENILFEDFPGVYAPTADGELSKPVWRTVSPDSQKSREKGSYLMIDGMYEELRLIRGFSGKQEKVTIRKAN